MVRGSWRPNRTVIYWRHSYGHQRCVFLVLLMLHRRPGGTAFCWVLAFFTASYQQLLWTPTQSGAPRAPSAWCGFPYHISSLTPSVWLQLISLFVLTELYNSSTPTQSPTRSLDWHVWSWSSGNNCHAIQRSLSSGVSVYECIMGFFTLSHFVSQFLPTRFPLITAVGMCHFLPVHHFEWHFWPGRRTKYNTESVQLFTHSQRVWEMRWIHAFPRGISTKWIINILVQVFNWSHRVNFQRR